MHTDKKPLQLEAECLSSHCRCHTLLLRVPTCCCGCSLFAFQVGKVLANDPPGRSQFVHSGGLAAVQQMAEAPGSKLKESVDIINSCYPEEVVRYYSPSYSQQLLQKLENMAVNA